MKKKRISKVVKASDKLSNTTNSNEKFDDGVDRTLDFICFWATVAFLNDHPLRPFVEKQLLAGTILSFNEGVELYEHNKEWFSKRQINPAVKVI